MEDKVMLLILYASQTGNAMDAAERLGREAERRGCPVAVLSTDLFDACTLPDEKIIVFVVSTTGQGDPPDSLKVFWRKLLQRNLAKDWLEGVNYALFGLGDSGYQKYNFVAKKLDKRLSDLGATALIERGLGDDQHPSGYEGALDPWMSSLWNTLYEKNPKFFPKGPGFVIPNMEFMDKPKMQVVYHEADEVASHYSNNADLKFIEMQIERACSMSPGQLYHEKNRPDCFLKMRIDLSMERDKLVTHRDAWFEYRALFAVNAPCLGDL